MFNTTNILINRHPVFCIFRLKGTTFRPGRGKSQLIPGRINKCIHRVYFSSCRTSAYRTLSIDPVLAFLKRRSTFRTEGYFSGKNNGEFTFRKWHYSTCFTIYNRNRCTPVSLPGNKPVSEPEVYFLVTESLISPPVYH